MESVNLAFILLDKTLKEKKESARIHNISLKNPNGECSITNRTDYDPEGKKCIKNEKNPLFWECIEPDHNDYYNVFLFNVECKYRNCSAEYRDEILQKSELRKVLLKNDIAEVGITIEDSLHAPTETCWGYSFHGYKYYIIKNGELFISKSRSKIRKIYNGKNDLKTELFNIRINHNHYERYSSKAISNIKKLAKNLFTCQIDNDKYLLAKDDSLLEYACKLIQQPENKEKLIEYLGGIDLIISNYASGRSFNLRDYFIFNSNDLCSLLSISEEEYNKSNKEKDNIEYSDIELDSDIRISGLNLYKLIK